MILEGSTLHFNHCLGSEKRSFDLFMHSDSGKQLNSHIDETRHSASVSGRIKNRQSTRPCTHHSVRLQ